MVSGRNPPKRDDELPLVLPYIKGSFGARNYGLSLRYRREYKRRVSQVEQYSLSVQGQGGQ